MPAPWEKYAAPTVTTGKPWEKYITPSAQQAPLQSYGRTVLDQSLQGATFGFADEVTDRIGAGIASLATGENYDELLDQARQDSKERLSQQFEQNPKTAIAANIGGGLLTGIAGGTTKAGTTVANSLRAGGTAARIGKGVAAGAASGGLYGLGAADDGRALEGAGRGAFYGGVAGGAIPAIGAAAGGIKNAILPKVADNETAKLAQKAIEANIPLRRSQIGGGRFSKAVASVTRDIPFSGAQAFGEKQQSAFNRAVMAKAGLKFDKATPELLRRADDIFGRRFGNIIGRTQVAVDDELLNAFVGIEEEATKRLGSDGQKLIRSYIDDLFAAGVRHDGKTYQNTRSALGKMAKSRMNADPFIGGLLKDMQSALDEAAFRSLPQAGQKAWERVRKQYGAYKAIEDAMKSTSADASIGNINPAALANSVKRNTIGFAKGSGELSDLARIGAAFVRDNVPNSGTAARLSAYSGLVGLPGALVGGAPGAAAGAAGGIGAARVFNALDTFQPLVKGALSNKKAITPVLSIPAGAAAGAIAGESGASRITSRPAAGIPDIRPSQPKGRNAPSLPGNQSSIEPIYQRAAKIAAVSPEYMKAKAMVESGGNAEAQAKTSTAGGLFQFTNRTWREMVKKYGRETNIKVGDKMNPEASAIMAGLLTRENKGILKSRLGREPEESELYLAHFLGGSNAARMLKNMDNPDFVPARVFSDAARSNRNIFFDGKKPRSGSQILALFERKLGKARIKT